jgi:hypothetical protein
MCCLLGSMVACLLAPCTSRERSRDIVHYNCLASLTAGLKQTTAFCMIAHLYHDLYQGFWAGFVALPRSLANSLGSCSPEPIPPWLGPFMLIELVMAHSGAVHPSQFPRGWALVPVPVTGRGNSPYRRPLHTKQKSGFGAHCDGREWERVAIDASATECTACTSLSKPDVTTAQAATLSSSKSALLHLSTTPSDIKKYIFPIFRAGILKRHGSESCTWRNRDLIRTLCVW